MARMPRPGPQSTRTKSYRSAASSRSWRRRVSRPSTPASVCSSVARPTLDGARQNPSKISQATSGNANGFSPSAGPRNTCHVVNSTSSSRTPQPTVEWACGSRSTRRTRRLAAARVAARLIAVVVLPQPPLWLKMVITRTLHLLRSTGRRDKAARLCQYWEAASGRLCHNLRLPRLGAFRKLIGPTAGKNCVRTQSGHEGWHRDTPSRGCMVCGGSLACASPSANIASARL